MHRLLLLGGALLEGPDGPVGGRAAQRHRIALLALLAAAHPRPLSRDKLIGLLWPESDGEGARHLLRQTLHVLRGTLGDDTLLSSGDDLRLDPERLSCDLWEFRDAVERGDIAAAVALHAGPLLDGFHLSRAEEFERWLEAERARMAEQYAGALESLAEERAAAGDVVGAASAWRRLAEYDPYHSRYALRFMQALEAAGDRAGALRHAALHAALLQTDLGVEPDPEVAALTNRLREPSGPRSERSATSGGERPARVAREVSTPGTEEPHPAEEVAARVPVTGAADREGVQSRGGSLEQRLALPPWARPLLLAGVLLVGLLGTLLPEQRGQRALALLGIGDGASLLSRGVLAERERVLLADFASPTGDTALARVATVAFRIDLAQSPVLTLVEPQQVETALERMQRGDAGVLEASLARELALREGIKAVLAGEIARSGSGYLLSAQVIAAGSGEILAAHRETARDSTALLPALDRLSKQLRRRVGESLRSLEANPPLAQVSTSSLEALRKYSQAYQIISRDGPDSRAIGLLEEAIALDTAFAMGYLKLAIAVLDVHGRTARYTEMLTRAYQHRHRLTDRERYILLSIYYGFHTREPEKAISALRAYLESHPDDAAVLHNLSVSYIMLGDYASAEHYAHRALAADSSNPVTWMILGDWQFNQGKIAEARATHGAFATRFPEHGGIGYRDVYRAAAQGEFAAAAERARQVRAARPEDLDLQLEMVQHLADLAAMRGRLGELLQLAAEVVELAEKRHTPGIRLTEPVSLARIEATVQRSPARALQRVERELARNPLSSHEVRDRPYADLAALYARAGQPRRARALLEEWEALTSPDVPRTVLLRERPQRGNALPWALGEIALAEGRPLEAARQFRQARQRSCMICMLPQLGRAYEAAGQADSAIAVYDRYLSTTFLFRLHTDAEWRAEVLERLGQLHEARGDDARAAEYYAQFIELWQDADPELQPRVREARRRVAALAAEGAESRSREPGR